MSNQFSITCNRLTTYFQEQSAKLPIPPALTAQAAKMMLAANSLFNFVAAGASRVISVVSNGKYLDGKSTLLFAQAKTDFSKAGAAGLAGFALSLVALVALYKKMTANTSTKADTDVANEAVEFINGVTIPSQIMRTLNSLFGQSAVEALPTYAHTDAPERTSMTAPVMKGVCMNCPYLIIKVTHKQNSITYTSPSIYRHSVIILGQKDVNDKNSWTQLSWAGESERPSFISTPFAYDKEGNLIETQAKAMEQIRNIISGKSGIEEISEGLIKEFKWYLTTPDVYSKMD